MVKFMRDKYGNLYSVKGGKVIGRIEAFGDNNKDFSDNRKKDKEEQKWQRLYR